MGQTNITTSIDYLLRYSVDLLEPIISHIVNEVLPESASAYSNFSSASSTTTCRRYTRYSRGQRATVRVH